MVVSIPFRVNPWVLEALECGVPPVDTDRLDESVLAYAAYRFAREKLEGTAALALKNKVAATRCGGQGGEFLISVTCKSTFASARRCAGLVIDSFRWGSLYRRYQEWCRHVGAHPDRGAFASAASEANAQMTEGGVAVIATGHVDTDGATVRKGTGVLAKRVKNAPPKDTGRPRVVSLEELGGEKTAGEMYVAMPAGGLLGVTIHNFVEGGVRGGGARLYSGNLYVPRRKEAAVRRLASGDRPDSHARALSRLEDELKGALVFTAARGAHVSSADLAVGPPPVTEARIAAAIRASLARES